MSSPKTRCKNALIFSAIVLAALFLVASLPALAVISVLLRTAILAIAIVALTAAGLAYWFSPRFRIWCASCLDTHTDYKGVRLRDDVALAPGHTWVRTSPHRATVGPDDLVQLALGPLDWVWLPAAGSWVDAGATLITLGAGDRELDLRAPVAGRVRRVNEELLKHPIRANEDPYGAGWAVDIEIDADHASAPLKRGCHAREWMRNEVDRFLSTLQDTSTAPVVMADGGLLVADLNRALSDKTWDRIRREFFVAEMSEARS